MSCFSCSRTLSLAEVPAAGFANSLSPAPTILNCPVPCFVPYLCNFPILGNPPSPLGLKQRVAKDEGIYHNSKQLPFECVSTQKATKSLLAPRSQFKLATFNVRTLMQIGSQAALARTLETLAIDICCLTETRLQDSSTVLQLNSPSVDSQRTFTLRLSGDATAEAAGHAGVGVALSARAETALVDWIPINSRLCAVRLEGQVKASSNRSERRCLFVVAAYAPTDCSSDAVKDEFYQQLTDLLLRKRRTDIVVLAGDLNAQVGRLETDERELGGLHSHGSHRTDNGDRLLQLCADHGLFLSSTNFRRPWRQRATWRPPSPGQSWTQIDHIAISYRWRGCITDCKSIWSTCLNSDHALVCAKFTLRFGGSPKRRRKRLDVAKLADPNLLSSFQNVLALNLANPPANVEAHWTHIRMAMYKSATTVCGFTERTVNHWVSARSLELLDARRAIPPGSEYNSVRKAMNAELKQLLREDRETWWTQRATEMEQAAAQGNSRKLFHLIRVTGGKKAAISETIREVNGELIHNLRHRLGRWAEHFEQQFNWPQAPLIPPLGTQNAPWCVDVSPPSEAEVYHELRLLKRHKSPGPDDLPPALFKDGGPPLVRELTSLLQGIWNSETIPSDWSLAEVVPVFKKGLRQECGNYRGISLLSVASKLLTVLLLRRLSLVREQHIREEQAGFRPGRGCLDHIFTLRQLLEHRQTFSRPTIVVFLDIRAAFDSVDRAALWNCLTRRGVPEKYVNILKAIYLQTSGRVRVYGDVSPSFSITSGVRQGCPASPFLFNFAMDIILESALENCDGVELLPGDRLRDLVYADDIALLCDSSQAAQNALCRLEMSVLHFGMTFAPPKCKVLLQDWQESAPVLTLLGEPLEIVEKFVYLGSCFSSTSGLSDEISSRMSKARVTFANLRHLWRRRDLSLSLKGRVYNATVRAVLLYGCEAWPVRADDVKRLTVFDHRCLRSIAGVRWEHRVSNDDVRRRVFGTDRLCRPVGSCISLRRLRWLGHVLRMPTQRLPRRAVCARAGVGWKRQSGGQRMTWVRGVKALTSKLASVGRSRLPGWGPKDHEHLWMETLLDMARNRSQWRTCCETLC